MPPFCPTNIQLLVPVDAAPEVWLTWALVAAAFATKISTGLATKSVVIVAMFGVLVLMIALDPPVPASPTQLVSSFQSVLVEPSHTVARADEPRTAVPTSRPANHRVLLAAVAVSDARVILDLVGVFMGIGQGCKTRGRLVPGKA